MCAMVSIDKVQIATSRPMRAAAHAASTPACPAPMTMISCVLTGFPNPPRFPNSQIPKLQPYLFPYTEALEDHAEDLVLRPRAGDLVEPAARLVQVREDEFLGDAGCRRR